MFQVSVFVKYRLGIKLPLSRQDIDLGFPSNKQLCDRIIVMLLNHGYMVECETELVLHAQRHKRNYTNAIVKGMGSFFGSCPEDLGYHVFDFLDTESIHRLLEAKML
jgi:hypothetical protein